MPQFFENIIADIRSLNNQIFSKNSFERCDLKFLFLRIHGSIWVFIRFLLFFFEYFKIKLLSN